MRKDNQDAVDRIVAAGTRVDQPVDVDFQLVAPNRMLTVQMVQALQDMGMDAKMVEDEEGLSCEVTMRMTLADVEVVEDDLQKRILKWRGAVDGWGTFGNEQ